VAESISFPKPKEPFQSARLDPARRALYLNIHRRSLIWKSRARHYRMEKLIATLHNNSMGAKSPSLVSTGSAVLSSNLRKILNIGREVILPWKIGRKLGSTSRLCDPSIDPLSAIRSVQYFRSERPFSKARHASVHN